MEKGILENAFEERSAGRQSCDGMNSSMEFSKTANTHTHTHTHTHALNGSP